MSCGSYVKWSPGRRKRRLRLRRNYALGCGRKGFCCLGKSESRAAAYALSLKLSITIHPLKDTPDVLWLFVCVDVRVMLCSYLGLRRIGYVFISHRLVVMRCTVVW